MNALTATDQELLSVLREAAGVTISRTTPEKLRRYSISYAGRVMGPVSPLDFGAKLARLEAVYDENADELQAIPLADFEAWTETQQRMRG